MGETLGFVTVSNSYEELNTLPNPLTWNEKGERKSCDGRPCWNGFSRSALLDASSGRESEVWICKSPSLQIDGQPGGLRVVNTKMPRLFAFARRVEMVIIETLKPRSTTLMGRRTLFVVTGTLEYSEMEPVLQCQRQDCAPDSSSLKPGSGATEGVLDKGVSGQPDCVQRPDY